MIFAHTWQQVLDGTKTQTRRTVKDGDTTELKWLRERCGLGLMVVRAGRVLWRESATYAVQPGRGKRGVGHLIVTAIRYCARAGDISAADAIAEGFASAEEFRAAYARINGAGALERPCWALSFERVMGDASPELSTETVGATKPASPARTDTDPANSRGGGRGDRQSGRGVDRDARGDRGAA